MHLIIIAIYALICYRIGFNPIMAVILGLVIVWPFSHWLAYRLRIFEIRNEKINEQERLK